ncbi:4'-phosphopantetheinyl transferase [Streptomyces sp. NBRC 110611]|uniref:hypothetical protein n=1 Tax=Streptomyces sp. NBRC 110611 TaxID=1621259 RepID=UPI00082B0AC7|nr:hypothetical protein [Streptomyces sp. NBRC 110611]GAU67852.1 4'-phosphopantetheinyl transferase [Streptomyces sp. NBRC 110611]
MWSPLTRTWLGFHEASVRIAPADAAPSDAAPSDAAPSDAAPPDGTVTGTFRAHILRAVPDGVGGEVPTVLDGTWRASRRLLLTAIVVPSDPALPQLP